MAIQTFTAKNMGDAMQMVRDQLGPDAALVDSREVSATGVMGWIYPNKQVEVTAATLRRKSPVTTTPARRQPANRRVVGATVSSVELPVNNQESDASIAVGRDAPGHATSGTPAEDHEDLRQKLINLRSVMQNVHNAPDQLDPSGLSAAFVGLARRLSAAEVPHALSVELIESVRTTTPEARHDDLALLTQRLIEIVADDLATTGGIASVAGQQRTVAVVGPAGIGKTTMLAKLAAEFQLRQGRSVALITTDNFRVAAADQLQTFADIIGVPLVAVSTPRDMRAARQQLSMHDLILVDTPGRSPGDDVKLQEVKSLLVEAEPDEVHLVQSCSSAPSHVGHCLDKFAVLGLAGLMLTKFDEAIPAGHLLPIVKQTELPISYVSDGQIVPDDMQIARSVNLAERFLAANN